MRAIDTNVLVRLITRDDAKQTAAAEDWVARGAWVSHLVLAESISLLDTVYGRAPREIAAVVDMLLDYETIAVREPLVVAAALATFREQPPLGFADCLILETARKHGHLPLGTFDRGLAKQAGVERLTDRRQLPSVTEYGAAGATWLRPREMVLFGQAHRIPERLELKHVEFDRRLDLPDQARMVAAGMPLMRQSGDVLERALMAGLIRFKAPARRGSRCGQLFGGPGFL